jgi:hypothetical protein
MLELLLLDLVLQAYRVESLVFYHIGLIILDVINVDLAASLPLELLQGQEIKTYAIHKLHGEFFDLLVYLYCLFTAKPPRDILA